MIKGKEAKRLAEGYVGDSKQRWMRWGPYLSERQWGTVREDYSAHGNAWEYFSHEQARSRAYRWGEDGLAGLSDDQARLCFSLALWNGKDPILKERAFGLTNSEGNHGEDVKEYYFYADNTPTHSYQKWLYKYPQSEFPYENLVNENRHRKETDSHAFEYELLDTGVFDEDRYFDVQVEYAKEGPEDIAIRIRVSNRGPDTAVCHLLPTLLFRNTWSWFHDAQKPILQGKPGVGANGTATIKATPLSGRDTALDPMMLYCQGPEELLFVENESNTALLWDATNGPEYPKDGINDYIVAQKNSVNPALTGTKASASYKLEIGPGETTEVRLRLSSDLTMATPFDAGFDKTFSARIAEADEFYASVGPDDLSADQQSVQRQAYAGMLWSKQFYYYIVKDWLKGDPVGPPPPESRSRNNQWTHFYASHVLSMPDAWEYPWFASWDLCFQSVVLARVDAQFAKEQLLYLAQEFYMSPGGAVPAYEWAFSDVNPPLHAWAALRIFEIDKEMHGGDGDMEFLADIFRYCLMYFTWWTNRKDSDSKNLFEGGFLGLDNISVIDRSHVAALEKQIGKPVEIYQSDGTSWMGLFCVNMVEAALKLARTRAVEYARLASKFFQHFVFIADAMNSLEHRSHGQVQLWDEEDGFFHDAIKVGSGPNAYYRSIKMHSLVGIIATFPAAIIDFDDIEESTAASVRERMDWFVAQHPELMNQCVNTCSRTNRHLLTFMDADRLRRILTRTFDESEFLSPHGIRGISQIYADPPFTMDIEGATLTARYEPAESSIGLFGGNSNWRGPVWFPINFLLIESLRVYHEFYGDAFTMPYPTKTGPERTLGEIADDLSARMAAIFERGEDGKRPVYGGTAKFQEDPHWKDHVLFFEYFHGDNGAGLGASHQTGWTGLVNELLRTRREKK